MTPSGLDLAITDLECATARLIAGLPDNTTLIEDALTRRVDAIRRIQSLDSEPDDETLARLKNAADSGNAAQQKLILSREQIRDSIARLNQSAYLARAFSEKSTVSTKAFDCKG